MPRIIAVSRIDMLLWSLFILLSFVSMNVYAVPSGERHTLIIANEDEGNLIHILELLPTGEIVTTGQSFLHGEGLYGIGVRPDQRLFWADTPGGIVQYAISPEGLVTTTGRFIESVYWSEVKFTPNSELLLTVGPIYRAYPDGSVESTMNTYTSTLYLSPRGDINIRTKGSVFYVDKIDYDTFSINSIQKIWPDVIGGTVYDVTYTPEGDYVAMTNRGGTLTNVEIYPILANGMLDTTKIQRFDMGTNANPIVSSIDGRFLYVGYDDQLNIAILRRIYTSDGPFEDTGMRVSTGYWSWQLAVSPDGKYLVANDHHVLETFEIQEDGNLVSVFKFPFETTFGKGPHYFQFAYPPAPTEVTSSDWVLYE